MKAIGFKESLPINHTESFIAFATEKPSASGRELLIKIAAISVNPVDFKIRQNSAKDKVLEQPKVIGWDAVGIVEETGPDVSMFSKGEMVYYSGDLNKSGSNAEYQLVDERIVGRKPENLTSAEAAAMPLTLLTAWEILFDRIRINESDRGKTLLIIGGAGGVGSIAIQIAKKVAGLNVIATASRPESAEWCRKQGADFIVNHQNLVQEVQQLGFEQVDFILDFVDLNQYWDAMVKLIKPQGQIGSISDPTENVNLRALKGKSVSFHWELMFTRSMFQTEDMSRQHQILNEAASLFENRTLCSTINQHLKGFTTENLKKAHALLESGKTVGKIVIEY
ncbi:zinc-binding alcohol dehydrogenase family protein [Pedobacter sp. Leaf170]|uniref:zinc-binding alcohol dehydrogenase family protein n=1 Tax=Pedobacter sp. Leaf170 TaxID=2876558 RepID=UPI001E62CAA9|nr:zinc-binding alcohol dehydrogenase family protein [Pedobacter sp. Leaf170]